MAAVLSTGFSRRGNLFGQSLCGVAYLTSLLGPADPSFRALSGHMNFTLRRRKVN